MLLFWRTTKSKSSRIKIQSWGITSKSSKVPRNKTQNCSKTFANASFLKKSQEKSHKKSQSSKRSFSRHRWTPSSPRSRCTSRKSSFCTSLYGQMRGRSAKSCKTTSRDCLINVITCTSTKSLIRPRDWKQKLSRPWQINYYLHEQPKLTFIWLFLNLFILLFL